ncbi:MAG: VWA domain-containing protein [Vicinamibacterales bacterium]
MNISVQTDRTLIRIASPSLRHALVEFSASESSRTSARPPVNVALAIDRSGSMGGQKIDLARRAVVQALQMLRPTDRFSIVVYDDQVQVLGESRLATREAVREATRAVKALQPGGNTDLGAGWLKACEQIAQHLAGEQIGRCLLLSDGLANQGITDRGALAAHANALRQRGVTTSTFGIGADFDERLLAEMARAGSGNFYYIEQAVQIPDFLTSELGEALDTVARDVVVTAQAATGVIVTPLNGFPVSSAPTGETQLQLGSLVSRQEVSLVFKLAFPVGEVRGTSRVVFRVTSRDHLLTAPDTDAVWTYADDEANEAQARNVVVDRAVADLEYAQASAEALELNRAGRYEAAQSRLQHGAAAIATWAGGDAVIGSVVSQMAADADACAAPMSPAEMKAQHFASMNQSRGRSAAGGARRRTPSDEVAK